MPASASVWSNHWEAPSFLLTLPSPAFSSVSRSPLFSLILLMATTFSVISPGTTFQFGHLLFNPHPLCDWIPLPSYCLPQQHWESACSMSTPCHCVTHQPSQGLTPSWAADPVALQTWQVWTDLFTLEIINMWKNKLHFFFSNIYWSLRGAQHQRHRISQSSQAWGV